MKKIILRIAIIIMIAAGALLFYKSSEYKQADFAQLLIVVIFIGFAIFVLFKKFASYKKGEPDKDELSQLLVQKAASYSFFTSLYLWLFISFVHGRMEVKMEVEQLIGFGIIGMAILFAGFWVLFKIKGLKND